MKRDRGYRRYLRNKAIRRKKYISEHIYGWKWYEEDGRYSKGQIYWKKDAYWYKSVRQKREKEYLKSHLTNT